MQHGEARNESRAVFKRAGKMLLGAIDRVTSKGCMKVGCDRSSLFEVVVDAER
jgi:hypothetical protein